MRPKNLIQMDINLSLVWQIFCHIHVVFGGCRQFSSENLYQQSRLSNYTFLVLTNIGMQKCIADCITRPLCRSVNFDRAQLICELNSLADRNFIISIVEFTFVDLSNETAKEDACSQCVDGQQCVILSSNNKMCVDDDTLSKAKDCTDVRTFGTSFQSSIYRILVSEIGLLNVYCDMDTDGGGWLVFQQRLDGTTDFYRNWNDYKTGFGNLSAEFWLGNDPLHYILQQGQYELRMDMSDFDNATRYVKYQSINIGDEASEYLMSISGYSGNVGDCFTSIGQEINNKKFTTIDRDNDHVSYNCAVKYKGGWWHKSCHCADPNGLYLNGQNTRFGEGITYAPWRSHYYSLKTVKLMIRRK